MINLVANSSSVTTELVGVESALLRLNETLGSTHEQGNAESGQTLAASSSIVCHGTTTRSFNTNGSLAGLPASYISAILLAYKNAAEHQGPDTAVMRPIAASLTKQDIADLAAYFSSLN